jgi:hypothetical protein
MPLAAQAVFSVNGLAAQAAWLNAACRKKSTACLWRSSAVECSMQEEK